MEEIYHPAVITEVYADSVAVAFEREESCGACCLKNVCHAASTQHLAVPVNNPHQYRKGQKVEVIIAAVDGWKAACLGYGIPLILMLAALAGVYLTTGNEDTAALSALAVLAAYYPGLYLYSRKHGKKLQIRIR